MESCDRQIIIDHHCHSLLKDFRNLDRIAFRQCLSETRSAGQLGDHMPSSLYYQEMLNGLASILNLPDKESPSDLESAVMEMRSGFQAKDYLNRLWDDVSVGALIVDDGFRKDSMLTLSELSRLVERPVFQCRRIETVLEACLSGASSFEELENAFFKALFQRGPVKTVALKTIAAYRGGLDLEPVSRQKAKNGFDELKRQIDENGRFRVERNSCYHYLLIESFKQSGVHDLPVQVHCGFGDDDLDLRRANPICFQEVLRSCPETRFVLLHSYPFIREAAYLSSIYPHVFMDLSMAVIIYSPVGQNLVMECLASAPLSKILAASDGHGVPEAHWWGARVWKRSLTEALTCFEESGRINPGQASIAASRILHGNSRKLYDLEELN